jgi:DNA-binding beta-propeller fold protein YncE
MMSRMEATSSPGGDPRRRRFRIAVVLISVAAAVVGAVLLAVRSSEKAKTLPAAVTLRVPNHPGAVVAGPDALWVALSGDPHNSVGDGRLLRLDLFTGARRPVYLGGEVSHLTQLGNHLIASVQHLSPVGQLATLDWRTGALLDRHWYDKPVDQVVVRGSEVWALEQQPGTLLRLDAKTLEQASALRLSPGRTLGMASGGGYLWVTAADAGEVLRIDPETHAIKRAHVGGLPIGVAFAGGNVWVADSDGGKVVRLDPQSLRQVGESIRAGTKPSSLIAAGGSVLVTDGHDGTVLRIDAHSGKRVGLPIRIAAPTSDAPAPSVTPAGKSVWVSSYASNTLDRIDPSAGPDEGGDKVTVRMLHTNDRQQGDEVIDGSLAGTGQFEASGAISGKGKVAVYRTFDKKNLLITLRYVTSDDKGTITYVVKIDAKPFGVARWTITSATKGYAGLHGEGTEQDTNNYTVQTLRGAVRQ